MKIFSFRNVVILLLVIAIAAFGVQYLLNMNGKQNTAQVVVTQHQDFVIATGSVSARDDVTVAFEDSGTVESVRVRAGDTVKKGDVIATLSAGTLEADVETQRSFLEKETERLKDVVSGPDAKERTRIRANTEVSERKLEQEVGIALVSAQRTAVTIENIIRTEIDDLFTRSGDSFTLISRDISVIDRQRVNKMRERIEEVLLRWRAWSNSSDTNYRRVVAVLSQFEKDLRLIHDGISELYDVLLPLRSLGTENERAFALLAKIRAELLNAIVETTQKINSIEVERANYQLTLAQADENLAGGTTSDKKIQSAQVEAEREKLRRLELQLAKTQVHAPFTGTVGEVIIETGQFVQAGENAARIVSKKGFEMSVNVTEVEIQQVSVGQEMEATISATAESRTVRVRTIDATEKRVNNVPVYTVVLDIIGSGDNIRPGMTVDVFIPSGEVVDVFAVPSGAVMRKNGESFVTVERGGTTQMVPVVVGAPLEDNVVTVTGALFPDDMVVFGQQ